jgi:DNA-binding NtrC family response regulator
MSTVATRSNGRIGGGSVEISGMNDILVVDDDALMRNMVSEWLTAAGYSVRQAEHGEAALAMLRIRPAGLVITDMDMPGLDGLQTLAAVRRELPMLPVIAMSGKFGSGQDGSAQTALSLGACKVLAKPFARNALLEAVLDTVARTQDAARR